MEAKGQPMFQLVNNEIIKLFKRKSAWFMIGSLLFIVIASAFLTKYYEKDNSPTVHAGWKEQLIKENAHLEKQLIETPELTSYYEQYLKRTIAINEYKIEHDLAPEMNMTMWTFSNDSQSFLTVVGLFTIVVAAGMVANEFQWGTIKLLLIRPITRAKILFSKYVTVLVFGGILIVLLFFTAFIFGATLFGSEDGANVHLTYVNGTVKEQSLLIHLLKMYALNSIGLFMMATMAFMISAVFRSSSLAIGISIFLFVMGDVITNFIAMKYEWAKYSLFANTNLLDYFEGTPPVDSMTLSFSIGMLFIYFCIFHLLAFVFFIKKDVIA